MIEKSIQIQFVLHQPVGGGKVDTAQHRIGQQGNQQGSEIGLEIGLVHCHLPGDVADGRGSHHRAQVNVIAGVGQQGQKTVLQDVPLTLITSNPARNLKLRTKGRIAAGFDADLCFLDSELQLTHVIARGKLVLKDKEVIKKGRYEE